MARTTGSTRFWGLMLRGSAPVTRRCTRSGTSGLTELEFKLGSHFALKGSGGEGDLTSDPANTTEGAILLLTLGVDYLEVEEGLTLTSHFVTRI